MTTGLNAASLAWQDTQQESFDLSRRVLLSDVGEEAYLNDALARTAVDAGMTVTAYIRTLQRDRRRMLADLLAARLRQAPGPVVLTTPTGEMQKWAPK